ncbi:MAG: hypothetical protein QXR48_01730 [Candidatus Woesearchaeota archaeon]
MNKVMKGLGTIVLALAGCTSPATQEKPKLTREYMQQVEQRINNIDSDNKRTAQEAAELSSLYAVFNDNTPEDDANNALYEKIFKKLEEAQKETYKKMEFYVGFTGVNTEEYKNAPGNVGITRPLDKVTGQKLVECIGEQRAYQLMSQLKPVEEYKGLPVTKGPAEEGGQRIVCLENVAVEMTLDEAKAVVGDKLGRLTKQRLEELTDGKKQNGEMYKAWLIAETCKGYDLPKQQPAADKK